MGSHPYLISLVIDLGNSSWAWFKGKQNFIENSERTSDP